MGITVGEGTVPEAATGGSRFGSGDEAAGQIDSRGVDLGILLRESTGIKAWAAAELKNMSAWARAMGRKKSAGDLLGVIAEEILAAEGVEPGTGFEETVRRTR
jgi:hypothetical protein